MTESEVGRLIEKAEATVSRYAWNKSLMEVEFAKAIIEMAPAYKAGLAALEYREAVRDEMVLTHSDAGYPEPWTARALVKLDRAIAAMRSC